jgi:hypothetical protein
MKNSNFSYSSYFLFEIFRKVDFSTLLKKFQKYHKSLIFLIRIVYGKISGKTETQTFRKKIDKNISKTKKSDFRS